MRIPPDIKQKTVDYRRRLSRKFEHRRPPRKGEYVTILDAALVESGLAGQYLEQILPDQEITWSIGKRVDAQVHHSGPVEYQEKPSKIIDPSYRKNRKISSR